MPETTLEDLCAFMALAEGIGAHVWLDGGWAVDACPGGPTRRHADLDIVVEEHHLARLVTALHERGHARVPRDDERPRSFVLGDGVGHEVDIHVVVLDETGGGVCGRPQNGRAWPAEALRSTATLCDREMPCVTPEYLVASHTGYELKPKDRSDVAALCARFDIPLPAEYRAPAAGRK
jgi:lincosamide nucleotidyltransferase A/C/D/E